jgi:hypothetical protein
MKTALRCFLILGFILTAVFTVLAQRGVASTANGSLTMTIHTYNYAEVDHKTLKEAEEVATGIFRKVGVESRWVDTVVTSETKLEKPAGEGRFSLSHIQLIFLSRSMADRLGLPNNVMGLAPGTGPDRQRVYLFEDNVRALAQRHMTARANGTNHTCVNTSQILGDSVAHEIGHLLLNLRSHSATGIMRGDWDLNSLQDACYGYLLFTPEEAEAIRIEVGRRTQTAADGISSNQEKGPETSLAPIACVQGTTPERESASRNVIGIMQWFAVSDAQWPLSREESVLAN